MAGGARGGRKTVEKPVKNLWMENIMPNVEDIEIHEVTVERIDHMKSIKCGPNTRKIYALSGLCRSITQDGLRYCQRAALIDVNMVLEMAHMMIEFEIERRNRIEIDKHLKKGTEKQ